MRIAVLGTGMVGQALAQRLAELGNGVTVGTRDVATAMSRQQPDGMGNAGFGTWAREHPQVAVASLADAASGADVVINATSGGNSLSALEGAGEANLTGKVLIDVANPLDFSGGMPPTLLVKDTDSLGEQIQRAFPGVRVVKALNTMNASVMVHPEMVADGDHTVFICGNDDAAKALTIALLTELGHTDILDLGDITSARGVEMLLPLWLRVMGAVGTPAFQFKVVR